MVDKILYAAKVSHKNIVLAVEGSSTDNFSISIFQEQKILQENFYHQPQFSELLIPAIEKILQEKALPKESISAIFATNGPGSFTSIRVVLSSLIAISLGLDIPLYTLDSLKTASLITDDPKIAVVFKAYKGEFYTAFFDESSANQQPTKIELLKPLVFLEKIKNKNYTLVGDGISLLQEKWDFVPEKSQKIITKNYLKSSNLANYLFSVPDRKIYKTSQPNYAKDPDTRLAYKD